MAYNETHLQILCVKFLTYRYSHLVWNHSPNEGKRSDIAGKTLKQMGMQTGWPDLDIIQGPKTVHVEFKTLKGKQTEEQKKMQKRLESQGHKYYLCRSYEEFVDMCHREFGPERDPDVEQLKLILNS